jgi:DNA-binding ferritin-like protein
MIPTHYPLKRLKVSTEFVFTKEATEGKMNGLKFLLSFMRALSQIYQYAHWKSAGSNYYGDHLLYERLYNNTYSAIDTVAEKAIGVVNDAVINPIDDCKTTAAIVNKFCSGEFNPENFSEICIAAEKQLITLIEKLMATDLSDGVENMLQGIADVHEGHLYLLQQRNKKAMVFTQELNKLACHFDSIGEFGIANEIDNILLSIATRSQEDIDLEKDLVLEQINKIETRKSLPFEDDLDHEILSFLREKYKSLEDLEKDTSKSK